MLEEKNVFFKKGALVVICKKILDFVSLFFPKKKPLSGWALGPLIFVRSHDDCTASMLNHELIHVRQFWEMFGVGFLLWYLVEYSWHRLEGASHVKAYARISFEQEAYRNQNDEQYLEKRSRYAWIPLMKSKNKKPLTLWGKKIEV